MWKGGEVERVTQLLLKQLGKPYAIGAKDLKTKKWVVRGKPEVCDEDPMEFDCSGLSRWIIAQGIDQHGKRLVLPRGSYNQVKECRPVVTGWRPLDLGFADMDGEGGIDHVIIRLNEELVVEARGHQKDRDYGKVITRPVSAWEAWRGFFGWFRAPGIYNERLAGEGAA